MAKVEIYTTPICPYCLSAKQLLDSKGVDYAETDVSRDRAQKDTMIARAGGRRTVPQIFVNDTHIGGADELIGLERAGKLDPLLASEN